jgi:hypothetical protein
MSSESLGKIPPPPPQAGKVPEILVLKERQIENPEDLSVRKFSKENLAPDRAQLAAEITRERREGRDKISELRVRTNLLKQKLERAGQNAESAQTELESFETQRTERANSLAGRFRNFLRIETQRYGDLLSSVESKTAEIELSKVEQEEASEELEESMKQLVDIDESLASLRDRISGHYSEAGDKMHRTVEQTMLRNNAFFVHTINEQPALRHNENSNVSAEATFEDDLDILLSLEPSLSASSLSPGMDDEGKVSGLWSQSGGVLLAGGKISAASIQDVGTLSRGIKSRYAFGESNKSAAEIDAVVQAPRRSKPGELGGYNEMVIDNPEIAGYFKSGAMDEQGNLWANGLDTRKNLERLHELYNQNPNGHAYKEATDLFQRDLNRYRDRFNQIKTKGLPFYAMTPDRRLFEVSQVNENGSLTFGPEITPEYVAKGRAGLPPEKRKEIGEVLLKKEVFRNQQTSEEAEQIIQEL